MTGAVNILGLFIFTAWLLSAAMGEQAYVFFVNLMSTPLGIIVLAGLSFTTIYHMSNGIRHLFWDMGYLFDIKSAYRAGYLVIISSIFFTALFWWAVCPASGG
jgi:succinate dehydrogenase / fumarate reductase cytochrome b subunit